MKNSKLLNSHSRFFKKLKRKIFFSNEIKKALLIAFYEAKINQTYVNVDLLLYGLISQPKSLSSKLIILTYSQFLNNKNLTSTNISDRIRKINQQNLIDKRIKNNSAEFSLKLTNENKHTPWLSPEVKEVLAASVKSALQTNKKIVVVNTKHILFSLLSKEYLRDFLSNLVQ